MQKSYPEGSLEACTPWVPRGELRAFRYPQIEANTRILGFLLVSARSTGQPLSASNRRIYRHPGENRLDSQQTTQDTTYRNQDRECRTPERLLENSSRTVQAVSGTPRRRPPETGSSRTVPRGARAGNSNVSCLHVSSPIANIQVPYMLTTPRCFKQTYRIFIHNELA